MYKQDEKLYIDISFNKLKFKKIGTKKCKS